MSNMAPQNGVNFAVRRIASLAIVGMLVMATTIDADMLPEEEDCGLWLGPSPIKEAEDHGWGHSVFTGKHIKKGTVVLGSGVLDDSKRGKVHGDLFVPVYDWESIDMGSFAAWDDNYWLDDDNTEKREKEKERIKAVLEASVEESRSMEPPLFHYLWNGESYPLQTLESEESLRAFVPGLSTVCPCTWKDFNLEQIPIVGYRDWREDGDVGLDESPPPPQAGSYSYLSNAMFVASRDILPGEELIVECTDNSDNFDPTSYGPTKFKPKEAGGFSICLDDKIEERIADHTPNIASGSYGGQLGLFAKRKLQKDEIMTSTPMIPVHKEEMTMDREKYARMLEDMEAQQTIDKIGIPPQKKQLLLNYMFGHPESSLLWLAATPLILAVNHAPHDEKVQPNAKLQWHKTDVYPDTIDGKPLSRRQQFHHAELLEMDSNQVALKHGMGLMVDLVALREIGEDEEILIDYGKAWDDAWQEHKKTWDATIKGIQAGHAEEKLKRKQERKRQREEKERQRLDQRHHQKHVENAMTALPFSSYVAADVYNKMHSLDEVRTVLEQRRNPYPSNLETACFFESDWITDEEAAEISTEDMTSESWYNMVDVNNCLLPCMVTERREYVPLEEHHVDDDDYIDPEEHQAVQNGGSKTSKRYSVKLFDPHQENTSVAFDCHIYKRFEYFLLDVPREAIVFINKPHSTDQWIDQAFRQPIELPDEMVPTEWKDLSRRKGTRGGTRKKTVPPVKEMTKEEEEEEKDYTFSVKKWNEAESRREKLEEFQDKWLEKKYSPLFDL